MTAGIEARPAWRCDGCGKVANRTTRPQHHVREGNQCGPFSPATIAPDGAVLAPAGTIVVPGPAQETRPEYRYRVTTLRAYACGCPRSTVLSSPLTTGGIGTSGGRGSLMHAAIAEILRTLWRHGEQRFERTEEAVAILREVAAKGPWVVTAADMLGSRNPDGTTAQSGVLQMIGSFAQEEWPVRRFMIIEGATPPFDGEGRMTMEIVCPDGEIRTLSGAPDLVIADPPSTAIIVDHKSGLARPREPREAPAEGQPIRGMEYLTDPAGDYEQLCGYAALVMHAFPAVKTVIGREKNWRWNGPYREVVLTRDFVAEHVIPHIAKTMMFLDQGRTEGEGSEFAQPRACTSCLTRCSVKRSCPIPAEERGVGALDSDGAADAEAARWVVVRALDPEQRNALKQYVAETGRNPRLPDGREVRWDGEKPNRKFGAFPPVAPAEAEEQAVACSRSDEDFVAAMEAELARQQAGAPA